MSWAQETQFLAGVRTAIRELSPDSFPRADREAFTEAVSELIKSQVDISEILKDGLDYPGIYSRVLFSNADGSYVTGLLFTQAILDGHPLLRVDYEHQQERYEKQKIHVLGPVSLVVLEEDLSEDQRRLLYGSNTSTIPLRRVVEDWGAILMEAQSLSPGTRVFFENDDLFSNLGYYWELGVYTGPLFDPHLIRKVFDEVENLAEEMGVDLA